MHGVRLWKSLVKPLRFSHVEANVLILVRKILPLHLCSKRNLSYLMFVSLPAQSFILGVNRCNRGRIFPIMFIEEPQARLAQLRRKMGLALFHRCLWDPASMAGACFYRGHFEPTPLLGLHLCVQKPSRSYLQKTT